MKTSTLIQLICSDLTELDKYVVSIIGGGGKSTLMEHLSRKLSRRNMKVIITSTTKFQAPPGVALVFQNGNSNYLRESETLLRELNTIAIASDHYTDKSRLLGVNRQAIPDIRRLAELTLIEADGSRQRGLKTHKEHEPVIPTCTQRTIVVVSAETVGQPLDDTHVHRAELFSEKWGLPLGTTLTPEIMARELLSPYGYLKNVPIHSEITFYVNKADRNAIGGKLLAEKLAKGSEHDVFLGSLKNRRLKRISHHPN